MQKLEKRHHPLYEPLAEIVGSKYVTDKDFALYAYSAGQQGPAPGIVPGIVVRPGSTEEISDILKLANETHISVVPRGGAASLYAYTSIMPKRSIVIDMTRLNHIIDIDEVNRNVTTEAGITTSELATKVEEKGFYVHTVFCPYYADTLGGLIAGVHGGGWQSDRSSSGTLWHYVLGFKVVLPTGDIVQTGSGPGTCVTRKQTILREVPGPDLTGLFICSGGALGIITEATLRIFPFPKVNKFGSFTFDTVDNFGRAMFELTGTTPLPHTHLLGLDPRGSSMAGVDAWGLMYTVKGYSEREVDDRVKTIENICKNAGGKPGPAGMNGFAEVMLTSAAPLSTWMSSLGQLLALTGCVPRSDFLDRLKATRSWTDKRFRELGLDKLGASRFDLVWPDMANYVEIENLVLFNESDPKSREKARELEREHVDYIMKLGSVHWSPHATVKYWSPTYYNLTHTIKRALDPNNILNPGFWRL